MTESEWLASNDPAAMLEQLQHWQQGTACNLQGENPQQYWTKHSALSDRKLRLFACACCWSVWHLLTDERSRRAVELAERFADDEENVIDLDDSAQDAALAPVCDWGPSWSPANAAARLAAWVGVRNLQEVLAAITAKDCGAVAVSLATQAAILHDLIENPFRPVTLPWEECDRCCGGGTIEEGYQYPHDCPACDGVGGRSPWLTETVANLATVIYAERAFDRLPILGDALEDAGCTNEDVLRHCRGWERVLLDPNAYEPGEPPLWLRLKDCWKKTDGPHARGCWVLDLILNKE